MRKQLFAALLLAAGSLAAQPLTIVNVQAPDVNFVFNPLGAVNVQDQTAAIWTNGFLQSRNFPGAAGAPAAGLYVYEYRVDLRNVSGFSKTAAVFGVTVDLGPNVPLDFNGDKKPDDVFVVTKGGLGTIGLQSAIRNGNTVKFQFSSAVDTGESSFFFGIVSKYPPHPVTVSAPNTLGAPMMLKAQAPRYP
jgi:hypothetical protein